MAMNTMIFESEGQVFTESRAVNEYVARWQAGGAALRLAPGEIRIPGKKIRILPTLNNRLSFSALLFNETSNLM